MKTIRTLVYKDLRRFWPHALTLLALLLLYFAYLPHFEHTNLKKSDLLLAVLPMAIFATWIFSVSFIVHDAPPSGTTEFWMTRPISGAQLFVSKYITLLVLFALIPTLVMVVARMSGLLGHRTMTLQIIAGMFSMYLLFTLCIMLLATLTRNSTQLVFSVVIIAVGFFAIVIFSFTPSDYSCKPKTILQNIELFGRVMSSLTIAGLTAIIYNQYLRRNRIITLAATALLALLLLALWHLWPTIPKP